MTLTNDALLCYGMWAAVGRPRERKKSSYIRNNAMYITAVGYLHS
jgi:hypothetical protein